jgi:hypothetical protein
VVEREPPQARVEEHLPLRHVGQRGDPRHEAGAARAVRRHPAEAVDLPAGQVHEDRLGEVVQVEAEDERIGARLARGVVQQPAPPDPAVGARDRLGTAPGDPVGRRPEPRRRLHDPVLDAEALRERPGGDERRIPVPRDPLVDRDRDEADRRAPGEVAVREVEGGRGILPAREGHGDRPGRKLRELPVKGAAGPLLDRGDEVGLADVVAPVGPVDDRAPFAVAAAHDPRTPGGYLAPGAALGSPRVPLGAYDY